MIKYGRQMFSPKSGSFNNKGTINYTIFFAEKPTFLYFVKTVKPLYK